MGAVLCSADLWDINHMNVTSSSVSLLDVCYVVVLCRYWTGYLYLCCELQRRTEAFSTICRLDDMSLLEEPQGEGWTSMIGLT